VHIFPVSLYTLVMERHLLSI